MLSQDSAGQFHDLSLDDHVPDGGNLLSTSPLRRRREPRLDTRAARKFRTSILSESFTSIDAIIGASWAFVIASTVYSDHVQLCLRTLSDRQVDTASKATVRSLDTCLCGSILLIPIMVDIRKADRVMSVVSKIQHQINTKHGNPATDADQAEEPSSQKLGLEAIQTLINMKPCASHPEQIVQSNLNTLATDKSYDLVLTFYFKAQETEVVAAFDRRVIDLAIVHKLLQRLDFVITQITSSNDSVQRVGDIQVATKDDVESMWNWNKTISEPINRPAHQLIEHQTKLQPRATAVSSWDGQLTYEELDHLANYLSQQLICIGIGAGCLVPLCFEKSFWTTVAILAVLKSGGGFVLLDPDLPELRLSIILEQIKPKVLLCSPFHHSLASRLIQHVMIVDSNTVTSDSLKLSGMEITGNKGKEIMVDPSSIALVVFTSGSTGTPKGVIISHTNLSSAVTRQVAAFHFSNTTRNYDFASYSFIVAIFNTFTTLSAGGCLCVPSDSSRVFDFAGSVERLQANTLFLTPSISETIKPTLIPTITKLILGGEAVYPWHVTPWVGRVVLFSAYGLCESTCACTFSVCSPNEKNGVSVGNDYGVATWVVDPEDQNRLLPPGCVGELLLEGPSISRGYLNSCTDANSSFIPTPPWLRNLSSAVTRRPLRLYKTGDLVIADQNGNLRHIGRKGTQTKVRGHRIDLGEIEHYLQEYLHMEGKIIVVPIDREMNSVDPILVAVLETATTIMDHAQMKLLTTNSMSQLITLEKWLATRLPRYMIPHAYFAIKELPRTTTGKIDRKVIRATAQLSASNLFEITNLEATEIQPCNQVESLLQEIWAKLLKKEPKAVAVDQSFFIIGGDSFLAMRAVGVARQHGIGLTVADIFHFLTIKEIGRRVILDHDQKENYNFPETQAEAAMSAELKNALLQDINQLFPAVASCNVTKIYPATDMQQVFITQYLMDTREFYEYFYWEMSMDLNIDRFRQSCAFIAQSVPILRACFLLLQEKYWQVEVSDFDCPFMVIDVDNTSDLDRAVSDLYQNGTENTITTSPALAFFILRFRNRIRFVIRLCHAQVDAISLPSILHLILESYHGKALKIPPDFSRLRSYTLAKRMELTSFWKDLLKDSSISRLTGTFGDPKKQVTQPDSSVVKRLMKEPKLPGSITIASVLAFAWATLVSHATGTQDIVFGQVVSGRNATISGVTETIGPCINIVPVRINLASGKTVLESITDLQEIYLQMGESELLGMRDIQECSGWPPASFYDFVLQYHSKEIRSATDFSEVLSEFKEFERPRVVPCIALDVFHDRKGFRLRLISNPDLATAAQLEALFEQYLGILGSVTEALGSTIV